ADKMVVMNGGRIQQAGAPLALYDDPANRFVAGFVGSPKMNFLPARLAAAEPGGARLEGIGATGTAILPLPGLAAAPGPVEIGIRPEDLHLLPEGAAAEGLVLEG